MDPIIRQTKEYVHDLLKSDQTGHDIVHTENVVKNALQICDIEGKGNKKIVELAALLHDISDWKKLEDRNESAGETTRKLLSSIGAGDHTTNEVAQIVDGISYYGPQSSDIPLSFEGSVVRDADRLEAMGQRAVERTKDFGLAYGIDEINKYPPNLNLTEDEYKNFRRKENSFVNHFFEKLLLLKNKLETNGGKKLGMERHEYMKKFLENYLKNKIVEKPEMKNQISTLLKLLSSERYI